MANHNLLVLDEREVWHGPLIAAAHKRGWSAQRIFGGHKENLPAGGGYGFIRTHAQPDALKRNQEIDDVLMRRNLTMVQDRAQVEVYENKSEQARRWGRFMPETHLLEDYPEAAFLAPLLKYPIVSKANEGASSVNIRILKNRHELLQHAKEIFVEGGIKVDCCAGGRAGQGRAQTIQNDYLLLQHFIPHKITWRVNVIGRQFAGFKRYCYPDQPVAQTGNVAPVMALDKETGSLFNYARVIFETIGTKWCAIDVLKAGDGTWKLLETSLAWPWPSPGQCNNAPFMMRAPKHCADDGRWYNCGRRWIDMMDVLIDELEAGVWD